MVARELLGKVLVRGNRAGRIVEVEAYLGESDRAAHAWRGLTPRTRVLYGPGGHAYVYLVYGMHECLNVVAEPEGSPGCVLIRAVEPVAGIAEMRRRSTPALPDHLLCCGPGRLTRAMGISRAHYGADLTRGGLIIRQGPDLIGPIGVSERVGIRYCTDWPLRYYLIDNPCVSGGPGYQAAPAQPAGRLRPTTGPGVK